MEDYNQDDKKRIAMQDYVRKLSIPPDPTELEPTPDGRAKTLPISFVQTTLDEIYMGLWETSDPTYQQVFNEVIATAVLTVTHPVTGQPIRRAGWASVVITQDKDAQISEFNMTKKKNALDLAFPKLGAEVLKNAASSLGKCFGRDINRKLVDSFKPPLQTLSDKALLDAIKRVEAGKIETIALAEANFLLTDEQKALLQGAIPQNSPKQLTNG